jgi:alpha-D-ribose 1-methylphosphonate 5-triphosphate diphosphatase
MPAPDIAHLPPLTFRGAEVLRPDGLVRDDLSLSEGRVAEADGRVIDLTGFLVLPGIVDVHGDAFERHLAPRRGAVTDLFLGLRAVETELAANGITTAWLAQFWSWEGGMRGPEFAVSLAEALAAYEAQLDLRMQLRLEIGCYKDFDAVRALIKRHRIGYVVVNDHLPHRALSQGKRPPRLEGQALKSRRSPADHLALLQRLHDGMPEARAALPDLAAALRADGVILGSHDDETAEARAMFRALGVGISEFPTTKAAAQEARAAGDPVVMGAPNVLRGGSHDGRLSAEEVIAEGAVTALASDYHYPTPLQAVFKLADTGMPLAEAWGLVSIGPARMMGLTDRGALAPGQRADLVIVEAGTRRVAGTIAGGRMAYLAGELALRMIP